MKQIRVFERLLVWSVKEARKRPQYDSHMRMKSGHRPEKERQYINLGDEVVAWPSTELKEERNERRRKGRKL